MKTFFYECSCSSAEHTMKFIYDKKNNELYTEIYLNQYKNLFKRIWVSIRYVFGYKSKYGAWDNFIFKKENIKDLQKLLKKIKNAK
jgi:hypothetical protein